MSKFDIKSDSSPESKAIQSTLEDLDKIVSECTREELEYWMRTLILSRGVCHSTPSIDWEATFTAKCRKCGHIHTREAKATAFHGFELMLKLFDISITPGETCPEACVAHALIGIPDCPNGCHA